MKACILNLVHSTQHTHIATKTPCHSVPTRSETDTITDHPKIDALIDICDSSLSHLPHSIEQQTEDAHNSATRKNRLSVLVLVGTKALVPVVLSGLSHAFDHTAFKVHHIPCSILVAEPCIYSQKKSHDRCPKTHNRTRLLSYSQHTRHQNKIKDKDKDQDQDQNQQQPPKEATSSDSKASALMLLLHQHDVLVAPFEWLWESASFPWEMIDTLVIYDPPQHQKHYLFASTTTAASYNIRVADDFGNLLQPPAYLNDLIVLTDSESPDQRQGLRDARQRLRVIKLSSVVDLQKDVSSNASVLSTTAKTCCDIKHHVASALLACGGLRVISHDDMPLMYPEVQHESIPFEFQNDKSCVVMFAFRSIYAVFIPI